MFLFFQELDPDLSLGAFTPEEDKRLVMLYKCWNDGKDRSDNWKRIARHMQGRAASKVEERASQLGRRGDCHGQWNEYYEETSTAFSLMIIPKNKHKKDSAVTTHEFSLNCVVTGTRLVCHFDHIKYILLVR